MNQNGVSIIICGYDASNRIQPTLLALQKQQFSGNNINWEVILVDNASTDKTAEVATEIWMKNPITEFMIVNEQKPGLMHARHKGLKVAKYEIISFIDDDNWVEPCWIEKIVSIFNKDEKIGACGGRIEAEFEKDIPEWFEEYKNHFAVGHQADETGYVDNKKGYLWGAGLSFRKHLWDELQSRGFKNLTVGREGTNINAGEDTELCYAFRLLGYRLYYSDDLSLKHFMSAERMNLSYLEKMNVGFGKAYSRLIYYKIFLDSNNFKLPARWYEWLAVNKTILQQSIIILFSSNKKSVLKIKIKRAYNKGYVSQIIKDKGLVNKMIEELKRVFKTDKIVSQ